MPASDTDKRRAFVKAAAYQGPVKGHTHGLYKYPARFSPVFARHAIEAFTREGGVVLDPFVGGGTTLVEARLAGRHAFGADISSLAVFLARTKTIPLSEADLSEVRTWFQSALRRMNIHRSAKNLRIDQFEGYDKNMPWRLRKLCEQYLERIDLLESIRQKRFARCVLLRCGQWAMDCRKRIPSADEFRVSLLSFYEDAVTAMREYRRALDAVKRSRNVTPKCRCIQASASTVSSESFGSSFSKADLVLTSPPYPGVHVLYHRWNVRGRRECPAPYWLADCLDGHGCVHYTLGERRQEGLTDYFSGIRDCFQNVGTLLKKRGLIIQLVAFSSTDWQLDAYLSAMSEAGFAEVKPAELGLNCQKRLWRPVPGRRWYSMIRGETPSSKEVVLFHRKK